MSDIRYTIEVDNSQALNAQKQVEQGFDQIKSKANQTGGAGSGMDNLFQTFARNNPVLNQTSGLFDKMKAGVTAFTGSAVEGLQAFGNSLTGQIMQGNVLANVVERLAEKITEFTAHGIEEAVVLQRIEVVNRSLAASYGYSADQVERATKSIQAMKFAQGDAVKLTNDLMEKGIALDHAAQVAAMAKAMAVIDGSGKMEAAAKLENAAMTGTARGLRALGITQSDFTRVVLEETMKRNRVLSEEEQTEARLAFMASKTKEEQLATAAAAGTAASKWQEFKTAMDHLGEKIGSQFVPALAALVTQLTNLAELLDKNPALLKLMGIGLAAGGGALLGGTIGLVGGPAGAGLGALLGGSIGLLGSTGAALYGEFASTPEGKAATDQVAQAKTERERKRSAQQVQEQFEDWKKAKESRLQLDRAIKEAGFTGAGDMGAIFGDQSKLADSLGTRTDALGNVRHTGLDQGRMARLLQLRLGQYGLKTQEEERKLAATRNQGDVAGGTMSQRQAEDADLQLQIAAMEKAYQRELALVGNNAAAKKALRERYDAQEQIAEQELINKRLAGEQAFHDESIKLMQDVYERRSQIVQADLAAERQERLDNQSVIQRSDMRGQLEAAAQKRDIERDYLQRSYQDAKEQQDIRQAEERRQMEQQIRTSEASDLDAKERRLALQRKQEAESTQLSQANREALLTADREAWKEQVNVIRDHTLQVFSFVRDQISDIWDDVAQRGKGVFQSIADHLKSLFSNAAKTLVSNQISGMFTGMITGQRVSFGELGTGGGILGALGQAGMGSPMVQPLQTNSQVTERNTAATLALTEAVSSNIRFAGESGGGGGVNPISSAVAMGMGSTGTAMMGGLAPLVGGPGGTPGFAGPVGGGGGGGFNLSSILHGQNGQGGGSTLRGGMGNIWKNLKGTNWGSLSHSQPVYGTDANGNDVQTGGGHINGVNGVAGAALTSGGMMAASWGLMGGGRGTWGGIAAGALGGAAIGFAFGGPLGAIIGGAAGAAIGIGEKIAGVETPERHAARMVREVYSLNIDEKSPTIKQIVALANSKYGGTVSMAVRSPEARELLRLYAQSSGQKSVLLEASQVHSASLVTSSGTLSQEATFINGTPYTYASNLPTFGPGGSQLPTSNPFNGPAIINLDPNQTANLWATGTAQAIAGNPGLVARSAYQGDAATAYRTSSANILMNPLVLPG